MEDELKPSAVDEYPNAFQPVAFADGVTSTNWGNGVVKFYLYRSDPHTRATAGSKDQVFGQVVMPQRGFVAMAAFFENTVKTMVKDGTLTQEFVDAIKSTYPDPTKNG